MIGTSTERDRQLVHIYPEIKKAVHIQQVRGTHCSIDMYVQTAGKKEPQ